MFVNFSSSVQYMRPLAPALQENKLKNIVTYCALAILFGCAIYWIYTQFWKDRQVHPIAPQAQKKNLSAQPKNSQVEKEDPQNFPDHTQMVPPSIDKQMDPRSSPLVEKKSPAEVLLSQHQPLDEALSTSLPVNKQRDVQDESEVGSGIPIEDDFDENAEDLPLDDAFTIEENIENRLDAYLRQEKNKYAYGGVFYRYEGVYAALKDLQRKNKADYVNFCNPAFMTHFEENKNCDHLWEINISIDPDQRYLAWKILSDEIENTSLCIQGAIHSSEKCQPGKGIILQFLIADHSKQKELRQFLTLLAHHLSNDSILMDSRPLNPEPLLGIIPCDGAPQYFSYGTDTFVVVDDQVWDVLLSGKKIDTMIDGKVVKIDDDPKILIKSSHYRTLGDARVNPFAIQNPFENLEIGSLTIT